MRSPAHGPSDRASAHRAGDSATRRRAWRARSEGRMRIIESRVGNGIMTERGGPTTQSGIFYQNTITALYLGRLCSRRKHGFLNLAAQALDRLDGTARKARLPPPARLLRPRHPR